MLQGRELGPDITSLLLHISSLRLMWQLAATVAAGDASDTAALNAYVQQRGAFAKVGGEFEGGDVSCVARLHCCQQSVEGCLSACRPVWV